MSQEPSGIFDMLGPIMIGPSSSHTAGVVRIARVVHFLLGGTPEEAHISFYNSFAMTYRGHGSDKAALAGLMGFAVDDERIREAYAHAEAQGLGYTFDPVVSSAKNHPNTLVIRARRGETTLTVEGISRGGGLILITAVNELHTNFTGQLPTLLVEARDIRGAVAFIAAILANENANIATLTVSRRAKADTALHVYELDEAPREVSLRYIEALPWVKTIRLLPPV
ncbi:MAG: L-serine ammonia-lyase, iron-sulfur-dependent subunit beta [Bacteroidia bacterium]|jgi:L-serine dehydratase|nr:L-serine ammonia-lyase, iron-sulfur-dependent subunit beta [Bacteroidia bacterium]GIV22797.1 MAG: L-serine dehydratase, iron-sulfur-dependent subunit beta [Bacteroidia bacterium]